MKILSEKIKDSKFINLVRKFLKAGYMEDWKYHKTYSGTPQGGILSPIVANIYLNELDKKVETMQENFNAPRKRDRSPAYIHKGYEISKMRKKYGQSVNEAEKKALLKQIHKLGVELRKLPSKDATDKKIAYVRYADDFIVGINGTREEAEQIKRELTKFSGEKLKLELSDEKTKITHSSEKALFLGYDVSVRRSAVTKPTKSGITRRTMNYSVDITVPLKRIEEFLFEHKVIKQDKNGNFIPWHRDYLTGSTDLEIIDTYNAQARGICNYYNLASNFSKLVYFVYLMEYSCLKTLAKKYKTHIRALIKKYRVGKKWGIPYETKKGIQRMMIVRLSDFKRGNIFADSDIDTVKDRHHYSNINSFEKKVGWGNYAEGPVDEHVFDDTTADKTVYAIYNMVEKKFTVRFFNGSELLATYENVVYGATVTYETVPIYNGAGNPNDYVFNGWKPLPENITANTDCYAQFEFTCVMFRTFMNGDLISYEDVDEIETLGVYAFAGLESLRSVSMPSLLSIPAYCFLGDGALTDVNLPEVLAVNSYSFARNSALEKITLPKMSVINDANNFYDLEALKELRLPKNTTSLANKISLYKTLLELLDAGETTTFGLNMSSSAWSNVKYVILRCASQVVTVPSNTNFGTNSVLGRGEGLILVPQALVADYKENASWSRYADIIEAIEDHAEICNY